MAKRCPGTNIPQVNEEPVECCSLTPTNCVVLSEAVPCLQIGKGKTLTEALERLCLNLKRTQVNVVAGDNIEVKRTGTGNTATFTVTAIIPPQVGPVVEAGANIVVAETIVDGVTVYTVTAEEPDQRDVIVGAGDNITVDTVTVGNTTTYTVNTTPHNVTTVTAGDNVTVTSTIVGNTTNYVVNASAPNNNNVNIEPGSENVEIDSTVDGNTTTYTITVNENPPPCGCIIETLYMDLAIAKDTNALNEGALYLITDFATVYDQPDYSDASTPKASVATKTGTVTPILLLATSSNTFSKEVTMPSRPKWRFEYDFDFKFTEYMNAPAKGRITWAKDEFNNETTYDHDVVLLKRYESVSGSGIFNSFWDTGFASVEVRTFGSGCLSNTIGVSLYNLGLGVFILGNNVCGNDNTINTFGKASDNNTWGNNNVDNRWNTNNTGNTWGDNNVGNTWNTNNTGNTWGDNNVGNTWNISNTGNTWGDNNSGNIFMNANDNNIWGNGNRSNIWKSNNDNNIWGDNNEFNSITNSNDNNTIDSNSKNNDISSDISGIDFTSATHVYQPYPCRIYKRQDGTVRLSYTDNTDTLVVVSPTT